MELDMVAVMEVDKVADMVDDMPWIFFMDDFFSGISIFQGDFFFWSSDRFGVEL